MEFEGRIAKVLPVRSGTRQDGSEWKSLPFVFEYFENPTDRTPDSVLLETMDHDMMRNIGKFVARGADNKAIEKDGHCELTAEIKCRLGFSHKVKTFKRKDGSGEGLLNNIWIYKLEIHSTTGNTEIHAAQQPALLPPQQPQGGDYDDLPF